MKRLATVVAACVLGLLASGAHGAVSVGDSVTSVQFKTADGTSVDVAKLKGRIVLIDFWATWCGPCMAEAPHMVQLNDKYGSKGFQLLGISLDRDQATMVTGAKGAHLSWPQYMDADGKYANMFGVNSIPRTFLVGPDGKVLWTGHPSQIDAAIEDAFKNHPPHLVDPKVLADATKLLDQIEEKITANDAKGAVKLLGKMPAGANADTDFAARATDVQNKLETAAATLLEDVDPLIEKGNYLEAISRLKDISGGLSGLSVSAKAKKKLAELMAKPEAKAAIADAQKATQEADRNSKADAALAAAEKLKTERKTDAAYGQFKQVAKDFSGTPAGDTAAAQVKAYEKQDPGLVKRANEAVASGKARAALSVAQSYVRSGRKDLARAKYQSVITDFPGTSFAQTAQEELSQLGD